MNCRRRRVGRTTLDNFLAVRKRLGTFEEGDS
jgi:hypothetical protein